MADLPPPGLAGQLPLDPDLDRDPVQGGGPSLPDPVIPPAAGDPGARPGGQEGPFGTSRRGRWPRLSPRVLAVVFGGGILGGLARYAMTSVWPTPAAAFPWAIFTVNTAGAFLLAWLIVVLAEVLPPSRYLRPLLGTGFLGAFTTFSTVMTATAQLAAHGHLRIAITYLVGSVLAALGAASFGLLLGRATAAGRHRDGRTRPAPPRPARRR